MMHRMVRRRAFTLIEVLIVVTIIGIAGAIVLPQMLEAGTMQIQAAGRIIVSDILYAQNEAITRQTTRRLVYDTVNDRYRLTDADGATVLANWKSGAEYVVDFQRDSRFNGVRIDQVDFGGTQTIEFDDLGGPLSGGVIDIVSNDQRYRITVAPFTGRVTIAPVP